MPKSKKRKKSHTPNFVNQERRHTREVKELVPKFYASVCISLHRLYGFGAKSRLPAVMSVMSDLWLNHTGEELLRMCSEETGINLITNITADEYGIKGDEYV